MRSIGVLGSVRRFVVVAAPLIFAALVLAAALAWIPGWYEQTQLPKRIVFGLGGPLALLVALLSAVLGGVRPAPGPAGRLLLGLATLHLGWGLLTGLFSLSPSAAADDLVDGAAVWCWLGASLLFLARPGARRALFFVALVASSFGALVGLAQFARANPGRFPFVGPLGTWEPSLLQALDFGGLGTLRQAAIPASVFGHANFGGEALAMVGPVLAASALAAFLGPGGPRLRRWIRWGGGGAVMLLLAAVLIYVARSSSRAALLALMAGLGVVGIHLVIERGLRRPVFGARRLHFSFFALLGLATLGGAWAAASSTDYQPRHGQTRTSLARRIASSFDARNTTIRERLDLWGNSLAIAEDRPVFGVGPGGFRRAYPAWADARRDHAPGRLTLRRQPAHPHNEAVELGVERGYLGLLIGLLIAAALAGLAVVRLVSAWRQPLADRGLFDAGALGGLLALGLTALVSFPLHHPPTLVGGILLAAFLARPRVEASSLRPWSPMLLIALLIVAALTLAFGAPRWLAMGAASRDFARSFAQTVQGDDSLAAARTNALAEIRHLDAALARRPQDERYALAHAQALRRFGLSAEAREAYEHVLTVHPYLVNAWIGLAELDLVAGRLESARRAARRALELKDDAPAAHLALARIDAAVGFERRAWSGLKRALALDPIGPERLEILVELVAAAVRRGDPRLAVYFLEEAGRAAPGHPAVSLAAARVAQQFAPGSPQALRGWEEVIRTSGENFEAYLQLGLARQAAGNPEAALDALDRARRLQPASAVTAFHRARSLIALGRDAEANAALLSCARLSGRPGGDLVLFERALGLSASLRARAAKPAEKGS